MNRSLAVGKLKQWGNGMNPVQCAVCEGSGDYPVIDKFGKELYAIQCPECWGSGEALAPEQEQEYEFAASTAAKIKTAEELREYLKRHTGDSV